MDSLEANSNVEQDGFDNMEPDTDPIPLRYRNRRHIVEYIKRICKRTGIEKDDIAYRIGARIRLMRKALGLSQGELGERIGITGDRVQKYENGARKPSPEQIHDFAAGLGANSKALVDPIVSDPVGAMFALFEMELLYGLKIDQQDGKIVLLFDDGVSERLNGYLREWERVFSSYMDAYEHASSEAEAQMITASYEKWKYTFLGTSSDVAARVSERQMIEEQMEILRRRLDKLEEE